MIEQFVALYPRGRITYRQTDFLELTTDVEIHRIKFIEKAQARIKRGTYSELAYYAEHPALLHYNYPQALITVGVKAGLSRAFLEDYDHCLNKWRNGWHDFISWTALSLSSQTRLVNSLPSHYYQSLYLPSFIAEEVISICHKHRVEVTRITPVTQPKPLALPPPFGMLSIGSSYVIARDFYVGTLR
jgi:hypothetical protein